MRERRKERRERKEGRRGRKARLVCEGGVCRLVYD